MPGAFSQLRVDGLTRLQLEELRASLVDSDEGTLTTLEPEELGGGKLGEPVTLAVIITFTPAVLSLFAVWLAKQKTARKTKLRYTAIGPDGKVEKLEVEELSYEEGESSAASIVAVLKKKLGIDTAAAS